VERAACCSEAALGAFDGAATVERLMNAPPRIAYCGFVAVITT
jgi:hypothetical protein